MSEANLPLVLSNWKLRRYLQLTPAIFPFLLVPENPSRWQLYFPDGGAATILISPYQSYDPATQFGLTVPPGGLYFNFRDSPVLCCGPWYIHGPVVAGQAYEAWETTLTGT